MKCWMIRKGDLGREAPGVGFFAGLVYRSWRGFLVDWTTVEEGMLEPVLFLSQEAAEKMLARVMVEDSGELVEMELPL